MQVVYVDEGTLLFSNLEELVLTGNLITLLSTAHLPAEIKVIAVTVFVCLFVCLFFESRVCSYCTVLTVL